VAEWKALQFLHTNCTATSKTAAYVAVCKESFGAFRLYEVASDKRTIVGKPMVAKESRHVLEIEAGSNESDARTHLVKKFCTDQQLARHLAN
jgi:hypothetical protein